MKKIVHFFVIFVCAVFLYTTDLYAKQRLEYGEPLYTYTGENGLNIISFSENWSTEQRLAEIYYELLNNFHGDEINYLECIYIYPDSPDGINGAYYESSTINIDGKYEYGNDSYIEIFNANYYNDISEIAYTLSHEYGHHFTYYYLITSENKYSNQWYDTEYAKIRNLDEYEEVDYGDSSISEYVRQWDIAEIAACDYFQLFASPNAKKSIMYKDITERVQQNSSDYYSSNSFNAMPQENLSIPLATDVDGLYEYWARLAGKNVYQPTIPQKAMPYIKDSQNVYFGDNMRYTIAWTEIPDGEIYEYTVVMYPSGMPFFPTPIKTVKTGEIMEANIGSDVVNTDDGEIYGILDNLKGEYEIRVFTKDRFGFIFDSEVLFYDFTTGLGRYNESTVKHSLNSSNFHSDEYEDDSEDYSQEDYDSDYYLNDYDDYNEDENFRDEYWNDEYFDEYFNQNDEPIDNIVYNNRYSNDLIFISYKYNLPNIKSKPTFLDIFKSNSNRNDIININHIYKNMNSDRNI